MKAVQFWIAAIASIFGANALWISHNRVAGDVAWYLYAIQRIRDGARLYHDIHDMNLPVVYLLHMPLAFISKFARVPLDTLLYAAIWLLVGGVSLYALRVPKLTNGTRGFVIFSIAFAALSLNRYQLGQRDPICAFAVTGLVIAAYIRAGDQESKSSLASWIAVATAAFAMAMKPHFLMPWLLISGGLLVEFGWKRALRLKEVWLPVTVSVVSWIVTLVLFSEFIDMWKTASRYYSKMNVSWYDFSLLLFPMMVPLTALLHRKHTLSWWAALASFGFCLEAMAQRKGFMYHLAPCLYFCAVTAALMMAEWFEKTPAAAWKPILATALMTAYAFWSAAATPPERFIPTEADRFVMANASGKTVLTLSTDLLTDFPLVFEAGAYNARRDAQLWTLGALYKDQVDAVLNAPQPVQARYHTRAEMPIDEREMFDEVVDIVSHRRPALILVQTTPWKWGLEYLKFDFIEYFSTDERFRRAFQAYRPGPASAARKTYILDEQIDAAVH